MEKAALSHDWKNLSLYIVPSENKAHVLVEGVGMQENTVRKLSWRAVLVLKRRGRRLVTHFTAEPEAAPTVQIILSWVG